MKKLLAANIYSFRKANMLTILVEIPQLERESAMKVADKCSRMVYEKIHYEDAPQKFEVQFNQVQHEDF